MTKYIRPDDTLNIYYKVSEDTDTIEHISVSGEEDDISKLDNLQNVQKIQWSPDEEHEDEEFTFDIEGFGKQEIKVAEMSGNIIDNFEDFSQGPYSEEDDLETFYSGDTDDIKRSTNNDRVSEGSYSIQGQGAKNAHIFSFEDDGLPNYPKRGDKFAVDLATNGDRAGLIFFAEDMDTYYLLRLQNDPTQSLRFYARGGTNEELDRIEFSPSSDFYTVEIDTSNEEEINIQLVGVDSLTVSDSSINGKGIGYYTRESGIVDNFRFIE